MIDLNKKLTYKPLEEAYHFRKHVVIPLSEEGVNEYLSKDQVTTHQYLHKFHPKIMKMVNDQIEYGLTEADRRYDEEYRPSKKPCRVLKHNVNDMDNNNYRGGYGRDNSIDVAGLQHNLSITNVTNRERRTAWADVYDLKPSKSKPKKNKSINYKKANTQESITNKFISNTPFIKKTNGFTADKVPYVVKKCSTPETLKTKNIKKTLGVIKKMCDYKVESSNLLDICLKEDQRIRKILTQQTSRDFLVKSKLPVIKGFIGQPRLQNVNVRGSISNFYNPYKIDSQLASRSPAIQHGYF
jgi:hypothetical protein